MMKKFLERYKDYKGMKNSVQNVVYSATPQIKSWLEEDDSGRIWKQGENPNCFSNNLLEALYVYNDHIKYWEDIRMHSVVVEHRIPESKSELYLII